MNRTTQKRKKMGYSLRINRTGQSGLKHWERVGFLFYSSLDASKFRELRYPEVQKYSIAAIRVDATPLVDHFGERVA